MVFKKLAVVFLILASCGGAEQVRKRRFLDIKGYVSQEVKRLEKQKATIDKTVSKNGVPEIRKSLSPDWNIELALFSESDINKPAWIDSYSVNFDGSNVSYNALDNKLRTRSIVIKKNKSGKLTELMVVNRTSNYLYSSSEELLYIPDSIYRIIKKQDVILLGKNNYKIFGVF